MVHAGRGRKSGSELRDQPDATDRADHRRGSGERIPAGRGPGAAPPETPGARQASGFREQG
ncbi:hypothetical protein TOK_1233 [Pseudonocardia sp. N23]|nr:hypothetical protein TOK_1233 [Pseudonocardia sp. N23]